MNLRTSGHIPVLLHETIRVLDPKPGEIFLDGTFGSGGHAREIARRIAPGGALLGLDRDAERVKESRQFTEECSALGVKIFLDQGNFSDAPRVAKKFGFSRFSGILLDLGFSSLHVDDASRGFSFMREGPLDMRYDRRQEISASEVVNSFGAPALEEIFRKYGDERRARQIAEYLVKSRKRSRLRTTLELADAVMAVKGERKERGLHPATKVFLALRIYVNDELGNLEKFLLQLGDLTGAGSRVAVISFHALEDAMVKRNFRELARLGRAELIAKNPIVPSRGETAQNPRARSAKLRAIRFL